MDGTGKEIKQMNMKSDVIVACDFGTPKMALDFLDKFTDEKPFLKIGMELFYAGGPEIVRELRSRGHKIFLDLKLHDIPNTVRKAMRVLSQLDVDMVNVHAGGGIDMMHAALEGLEEGRQGGERPLIIAVTQLTSTSQAVLNDQLLVNGNINDVITQYAWNAREAGLDGVVCSPLEAAMVKERCGAEFLAVTPGIRYPDAAKDDQSRITTPARAREIGSDFIVVGRPITAAADPVAAYRKVASDFLGRN
jgi:orotidine-5'-phosphate decarboxylase